MPTVIVNSYNADGSLISSTTAVSKQKAGEGYRDDAWKIFLSNGRNIVYIEEKLDQLYPGWRELPEAPTQEVAHAQEA
jgi:hypothetical protein